MNTSEAANAAASACPSSSSDRSRFPKTIPVWPVDEEGHCTCYLASKCKRPGKHADAKAPETGPYAVITGEAGGVFVLDVDTKGGTDGFAQVEALGEIPKTLVVQTPGKGIHAYFKHPGFNVQNRKPASAIDIRGDKQSEDGLAYVIGPGSAGFTTLPHDRTTAYPGEPYTIILDEPIAEAPDWLYLWLKYNSDARTGTEAKPMSKDNPLYPSRYQKGVERAKTMPESKADGEGGANLLRLCLKLVRTYELTDDDALAIIKEHFNPRCTNPQGKHDPWDDADIMHKLYDARNRSDLPCGLDEHLLSGLEAYRLRKRAREEAALETKKAESAKEKIGVGFKSDGERKSLSRTALADMLKNWPAWEGVFWFDVLSQRPYATNPPLHGEMTLTKGRMSKGDLAQIAFWFDAQGYSVSKEAIEDALFTITREPDRQRNVIAEYLDGLEPATDTRVLDTLATDIFGAKDDFANLLLKKTLVGAVRRARKPGYPHKGMLVLKGVQGCGKTPAVKILAGEDRYFSTGNGDITSDWTQLACAGNWLVEVEEMSAIKKDVESLKSAISRTHDTPNVKYEKDRQHFARSFVFIATTNKESFLVDPSGDARYWTIEVDRIDLARLEELRDRIWSEADLLARTMPERWNYLTQEEEARLRDGQKAFRKDDPFLAPITELLTKLASKGMQEIDELFVWEEAQLGATIRPTIVTKQMVEVETVTGTKRLPSQAEQDRIEACFQILECTRHFRKDGDTRPRISGRRVSKWWRIPSSLAREEQPGQRATGPEVDHVAVQPN